MSSASVRAIDASDELTAQIVELQKLIIDQETGLRGLQLTGDPMMLAPYKAAIGPINQHFDNLQRVTGR